jgi:hypothetical protein
MHTKNLWILWLRASQSIDYDVHGSQCRKHLRPQHESTVRCFFPAIFLFNNFHPWPILVISYWKNFISFTNVELCMETSGLPTSSCRMDLLILSISHMDTNINAQGTRRALSLSRHVNSCCCTLSKLLEQPLQQL